MAEAPPLVATRPPLSRQTSPKLSLSHPPSPSPSPPPGAHQHPPVSPTPSSASSSGSSRSPRGLLRRLFTVIGSEVRNGANRPRSKSSGITAHEYGMYRDGGGVLRPRAASTPDPFGGGVPSIQVMDEILLEEDGGGVMEFERMREGSECGSSADCSSAHSSQHSPDVSGEGQRRKKKKWLDISSGAIPNLSR
ncbi:WAS/WASL-interacting protein family member 3-like [Strongylocentrotus purpuratus]|uniref:Uncharacterized protein n=1 Tax=Strongylocentrotus purpuratus TaxID=7668 RepID=A0A7M7NJF9_STRPU|nr:WAS/WASL-interacting protein family member 3-like [Strongylocentrotus purpuratus]